MIAATSLIAAGATAQPCGSVGPDVILSDAGAGVTNYTSENSVDAFSIGIRLCNIGAAPIAFTAGNSQHPIITPNLYRLKTVDGASRFEQIGMGWCFHSSFALSEVCCAGCQATNGTTLGVRCSSPDSSNAMGARGNLGPRYQVNAATGVFVYPPANPAYTGSTARRLQASIADLDPAQHGGGRYFVENIVIAPDDSNAGNNRNNASYRETLVSGSGTNWNLSITSTTQAQTPAVHAWQAAENDVVIANVDVPGDGRFVIGAKATLIAPGVWRYEYAVQNLTSHRSANAFAIPLPPGIVPTSLGFHDVSYHSGDGIGNVNFDGTDWTATIGSALEWSTQTFTQNPSANALRWGTLYNFRFDAPAPPVDGVVTLALFRPGTPSAATAIVPIPGGPACAADWNHSGAVNSQDFFDFLTAFLANAADFNGDLVTNTQDFFDFLTAFFAGC